MRPAGSVALAGVALTLAALTFGSAPLLVPGVAFTLLGCSAPIWVWAAARRVWVRRRLECERVLEDEPVQAVLELERGRLGLVGVEVVDPLVGSAPALARLPGLLRSRRRVELQVEVRLRRRGRHRLPPPAVIVRDPLGLARLLRPGRDAAQELLILPRTEPVSWSAAGRTGTGRQGTEPGPPLAAVDVDGLRPYREGTPASRIHWPALARSGVLLERRLQADGDARPLVLLDPRGGGSAEDLDAAVRAAASLVLELARWGGCRVMAPGDLRPATVEPDLARWPAVHARLALVQGGARARTPALAPSHRRGALFLVAPRPSATLSALRSADGQATVLVLPEVQASRLVAPICLRVAGCYGLLLGAPAVTGLRVPAGARRA